MKQILLTILTAATYLTSVATPRLPKIFNNDMVLQRLCTIPIWGWADPSEKITVHFNLQSKTCKTGKDGKWRLDLDPEKAGGPYELIVQGKGSISISNVLVGEVWICSGQSNMEMPIADWGFINDYKREISQANYPAIRTFNVTHDAASAPRHDITGGKWLECNPQNAALFSATAYFFARDLYKELKIPIGIINTSWGGTHIETWTSRQALSGNEEYAEITRSMQHLGIDELIKKKKESLLERIKMVQGLQVPTPAEIEKWKSSAYDDAGWRLMDVPGLWEQQELGDFDGVVWLRKSFTIEAGDTAKIAVLELGKIDDNDETFINGVRVGGMNGYAMERKYTIPPGILKAGLNLVAIRVDDTGGGGGLWSSAMDVKLDINNKLVPLAGKWSYNIASAAPLASAIGPNSFPSLLFNGMINPLIPFAIKGAIWYQGESNSGRAYQYRTAFPLMISDWRQQWKQGDFPFYFVQLSSWNANNGNSNIGSEWAELREAQAMTLTLPNTGMAVTTDIGDAADIHPKNKQDVGKRLAVIALNKTYGMNVPFGGPVYASHQVSGSRMTITFKNIGKGLLAKDKYGYLRGFELGGSDHKFHYARAVIRGESVIVESDDVPLPIAVRYGWADDDSEDNLFNMDGFPAAPFRTDDWKGKTDSVKYKIGD